MQFTLQSGGPLGDPLPYYTMLPRFTYLAVALPKALTSFNRREDGGTVLVDKNIWLELNGAPVKMYVPIGVIYDQLNTDSILEISVKTTPPPVNFQMVDLATMQAMFTQSIKQADYLKTEAAVTQSMMKDELPQLWRSVVNNNFDEFWAINRKLMETDKEFKHVPLRVYVGEDKPFKQDLVKIKRADGSLRTIGEAVSEILRPSSSSSTPSSESSTPTSESEPSTPPEERRLISHGIEIPAHTPLIFAAKNLSYPDNFVHIVIASN